MSTRLDSGTYLCPSLSPATATFFFLFLLTGSPSFPFSANTFKREKSTISSFALPLSTVAPVDAPPRQQLSSPSLAPLAHFSLYACSQFDCRALRNYGGFYRALVAFAVVIALVDVAPHIYRAVANERARGKRRLRRHDILIGGAPKCRLRARSFVTVTQFSSSIGALADFQSP